MMWIVALPSCSDDSDRQKKVASKPLVVAVRGACFAGGLELALNCDAIVAAQETLFRQPEVARGIFAFGGGEAADRHYRVEAAGVNGTSSRCLRSVLMAQMPTLATSLLQGLKDHGAREIFGIPGDFVLPFFKVIEESGILPHFTLSHEPGVGFAAWGLPAPRITYDWRRPNEAARVEYMLAKMEEIGRTMGASQVWRAPRGPGAPGAHHEGGTRMGNDPKNSVVNRYGQSWDIPNLFVVGSSTFPTMSGFNPTLTIQALAYMSADAIANRYRKNPGPLL